MCLDFQFFGGNRKSRPGINKAILLITDGSPADADLLQEVVRTLKEQKVKIVSVAIGSTYDYIQRFRYIVRSISSGFKQAFRAQKDHMQVVLKDVVTETCTRKTPSPPKGKPGTLYAIISVSCLNFGFLTLFFPLIILLRIFSIGIWYRIFYCYIINCFQRSPTFLQTYKCVSVVKEVKLFDGVSFSRRSGHSWKTNIF